MRRIKEVLRLRYEVGLGQRQIARSCSIGLGTVHEYLRRAQKAGLTWPLPAEWSEDRLDSELFGRRHQETEPKRSLPDFAGLHEQLGRHPHLTLQLAWQEYRESHPEGYGYSRYCELYQRWKGKLDVVLRQQHRPGEKMFVDWAGATLPIHDRATGQVLDAPLFVAVLGASSYTWAEATRDQQLESWLMAQTHALEHFGGAPQLIVPDNVKTGVTRACRYDPDLNPTYQEWALHYGVGVLPARPYKPRDKAKVESGVQVVQRWIVAALRHQRLLSVEEANQSIRQLLVRLNERPFRKRDGSRRSLWETLDRPALRTLPAEPFDMSQWARARVNIDYHIAFDGNFYSVPYTLVHEMVEIRSLPTTVEIFHKGQRVASHVRSRSQGKAVSNDEHRPKSHQAHLEWTPSRMVNWAQTIGPATARLLERIMADKPHPEMGYRACLGIIRLAKGYSSERMEAAAERALLTGACRYKSVESILKNSLDAMPVAPQSLAPSPAPHDNIRGAEYFA